jgi:hypothetical protein
VALGSGAESRGANTVGYGSSFNALNLSLNLNLFLRAPMLSDTAAASMLLDAR